MTQVDKTVKVEAKTEDMLEHVASLLAAAKKANANGASWSEELPADVAALVMNLPSIVGDAASLASEFAESKEVFTKTVVMGAFDLVDAILE